MEAFQPIGAEGIRHLEYGHCVTPNEITHGGNVHRELQEQSGEGLMRDFMKAGSD